MLFTIICFDDIQRRSVLFANRISMASLFSLDSVLKSANRRYQYNLQNVPPSMLSMPLKLRVEEYKLTETIILDMHSQDKSA